MNLLRSTILLAALLPASQASANSVHDGFEPYRFDLNEKRIQLDFTEPELRHSVDEQIDIRKHRDQEVELRDDHVNAIPLPAAGWLFGTALIGFVVVANRRF